MFKKYSLSLFLMISSWGTFSSAQADPGHQAVLREIKVKAQGNQERGQLFKTYLGMLEECLEQKGAEKTQACYHKIVDLIQEMPKEELKKLSYAVKTQELKHIEVNTNSLDVEIKDRQQKQLNQALFGEEKISAAKNLQLIDDRALIALYENRTHESTLFDTANYCLESYTKAGKDKAYEASKIKEYEELVQNLNSKESNTKEYQRFKNCISEVYHKCHREKSTTACQLTARLKSYKKMLHALGELKKAYAQTHGGSGGGFSQKNYPGGIYQNRGENSLKNLGQLTTTSLLGEKKNRDSVYNYGVDEKIVALCEKKPQEAACTSYFSQNKKNNFQQALWVEKLKTTITQTHLESLESPEELKESLALYQGYNDQEIEKVFAQSDFQQIKEKIIREYTQERTGINEKITAFMNKNFDQNGNLIWEKARENVEAMKRRIEVNHLYASIMTSYMSVEGDDEIYKDSSALYREIASQKENTSPYFKNVLHFFTGKLGPSRREEAVDTQKIIDLALCSINLEEDASCRH